MAAFRAALAEPLTVDEEALFSAIYLKHGAYGGLPSLVLHDRFDFLREAILRTWARPDDKCAIAIVHRMMFYYSELIGNRRASDRRYKQKSPVKVAERRGDRSQETFIRTACRLAAGRESDCVFDGDEWDAKLLDEDGEQITFQVLSIRRKFDRTYSVPISEFKSAAEDVVGECAAKADPKPQIHAAKERP
jgi:hypothetical protein